MNTAISSPVEGKIAIVTGAAKGVGLAVARLLAARGAKVMAADPDEAALKSAFAETTGDEAIHSFTADMSQRLAMANLVSATLDRFERIDILVNTHRLVKADDPLASDERHLDEMLHENLMAGLRLSTNVVKRMIKQAEAAGDPDHEAGSIVNISSLATKQIQPRLLAYSIAAAAQDQATRTMALALAPKRIRVNGVRFASVMSEQMRGALKEHEGENLRAKVIAATPMARIGSAAEVASAVLFLASSNASFITGQILTVDGGRSLGDAVPMAIE